MSPSMESEVAVVHPVEKDTPTLLEVLIGTLRQPVKSESDLVKALECSRDHKDIPTIISFCADTLPADIFGILYNAFPQLHHFNIILPGFPEQNSCFVTVDSELRCDNKRLQCSCVSTGDAADDCGWKCDEVLSTHYAEKTIPASQGNSPEHTPTATDIPEIVFRPSPQNQNLNPNQARDGTKNKQHVFTPQQRKFYFLSNQQEGRRIIFKNGSFAGDTNICPTTLEDIMSLDQICKEWESILRCFTRQLNDARVFITTKNKTTEDLENSITDVTEKLYQLETIHQYQSQWIDSLGSISWKGDGFSECSAAVKGMEIIGKDISNKMDMFFQRTSNIISIYESLRSREQTESMRRLSRVTFIFLPLLFVASLYGMNVDILQDPSPSWTTYFYIAVPVFVLVMASVFVIKYQGRITAILIPVMKSISKIVKLRSWIIQRFRKIAIPFQKTKVVDVENGRGIVLQSLRTLLSNRYDYQHHMQPYIQLLCDSIRAGSTTVAELLISVPDMPLDNPDQDNWTAVQLAALQGQRNVVSRLLDRGVDISAGENRRQGVRTALQAAAGAGHLEVVNQLLRVQADVNAEPSKEDGRTALQAAAEGGHLDVVNRLLESNADINAIPCFWHGRTALQAAAGGGHFDVVNRLLEFNADVNAEPSKEDGRTALQAAAGGGHLGVVKRLLEFNADVDAGPSKDGGRTALQAAAEGGHLHVVNRLLESEVDVNAVPCECHGRTALQAAAEGGHLDVVNRLLESNGDVNAEPSEWGGRTALQAAAGGGHLDVVKRLLEFNADVDAGPSKDGGRTALQAAAEGGHLHVVNRLLELNADVNAEPSEHVGRTALQGAAGSGHLDIVRRLLNSNADVNAAPGECSGRTALQAAAGGGQLDVVNHLLQCGANANAQRSAFGGRTALQAAAEAGHLEVVRSLLDACGDVNASAGYFDALEIAVKKGHGDVVRLLQTRGQ
ncbi:ankyrin repeat-containing domain protein [Pyronema omphalodes]|nr:ankyrin repeat-containing domain protein [Pyronema omphalodes]